MHNAPFYTVYIQSHIDAVCHLLAHSFTDMPLLLSSCTYSIEVVVHAAAFLMH